MTRSPVTGSVSFRVNDESEVVALTEATFRSSPSTRPSECPAFREREIALDKRLRCQLQSKLLGQRGRNERRTNGFNNIWLSKAQVGRVEDWLQEIKEIEGPKGDEYQRGRDKLLQKIA